MRIASEKKLVGVCGLYCRLCPEYKDFRMGIAESAERLRCLITEMVNVNAWPWNVNDTHWGVFNFDEFMKGLKWLSCQKALCKGCGSEVVCSASQFLPGKNPDCKIKKCCLERSFRFCYECPDFACAKLVKLEEHYPSCLRNLRRMKDAGIERWLEEQQVKVKAGLTNRK